MRRGNLSVAVLGVALFFGESICSVIPARHRQAGNPSVASLAYLSSYGWQPSLPCVMAQTTLSCPFGAIHLEGGGKTAGFDGGIVTAFGGLKNLRGLQPLSQLR